MLIPSSHHALRNHVKYRPFLNSHSFLATIRKTRYNLIFQVQSDQLDWPYCGVLANMMQRWGYLGMDLLGCGLVEVMEEISFDYWIFRLLVQGFCVVPGMLLSCKKRCKKRQCLAVALVLVMVEVVELSLLGTNPSYISLTTLIYFRESPF